VSAKRKIIYRRMTAEDIPWFIPAFKEYYPETSEEALTEDMISGFLSWYLAMAQNPAALMLGAFSGKRVAGFTCVFPMASMDGKPWAFIDPFYVVKEYRNEGIALTFVKVLNEWVAKAGFKKVLVAENPSKKTWSKKDHLLKFKPYRNLLIKEV
jgi:GNAT superfamily N-acetyltransferase